MNPTNLEKPVTKPATIDPMVSSANLKAPPKIGAKVSLTNSAIVLNKLSNGFNSSLLADTAFLILLNAPTKPSKTGPTIAIIPGMIVSAINPYHALMIGKTSSRIIVKIWEKAGPSVSPKFFAKSWIAGMPLSTKLLTNGVSASSTYDPTVSLASSKATDKRAILPSNVSACLDA